MASVYVSQNAGHMVVVWSYSQGGKRSPPHPLAWQYALQFTWCEAQRRGVSRLSCESPWELGPDAGLESSTASVSEAAHLEPSALACLGTSPRWPDSVDVVIVFGPHRQAAAAVVPGWRLSDQYAVYTRTAKFYGGVMRLARWARMPGLEDWAMFRVRQSFAVRGSARASYSVAVWERRREGVQWAQRLR